MLECLILGDSIAVGLHSIRKECVAAAKSGINSWQFNKKYTDLFSSKTVIISLGSNDHKYVKSAKELEDLRKRISATEKVIWILPSGNLKASEVDIRDIREIIIKIAEKNGDKIIGLQAHHVSTDGIHPTGNGYRWLADYTKTK